MKASSRCPDVSILRQLSNNALDAETQQCIASHVADCQWCRQQLEQQRHDLTGGDTDTSAAQTLSNRRQSDLGDITSTSSPLYDFSQLNPSPNPTSVGRLGHYDIIGLLGAGGMGVVLKAHDSQLGREVAIKVLSGDLAAVPAARKRFLSEARAVAQIQHPNVVTIHSVSEHQGQPYLVMEMLRGGSLGDRIRHHKHLSISETIRYGKEIASALAAAHERGVTHRDIKPGNAMLDAETGAAKITDFGLAELEMSLDQSEVSIADRAIGTPAYMSPEQAAGAPTDQRSDLFSLGCVLYAMLCGRSPFSGSHNLHSAWLAAGGRPASPCELNKECPVALSALIQRLIEKSPDDRMQTAAEVVDLLDRIERGDVTGDDLSATQRIFRDDTKREPTRDGQGKETDHRSRFWVGVGLLAMIAIIFTGVFLPKRPKQDPTPPPAPIEARRSHVTVAKDRSGEFTAITEAIKSIAPGGVIEILDDGEYAENISISDRGLTRLTIEAKQGATLVPSDDEKPVIMIHGVADVTIRGVRIRSAGHVGLQVSGSAPDLLIEDVHFSAQNGSDRAVILIEGSGQVTKPMTFRRLKVRGGKIGMYLGKDGGVVSSILVEDCDFGVDPDSGVLFIMQHHVDDVVLRGNQFHSCWRGVSWVLSDRANRRILVQGNAFTDLSHWVASYDVLANPKFQFRHNLIRNCQGVHEDHEGQLAKISSRFEGNLWVKPPLDQLELARQLTVVVNELEHELLDPSGRFLKAGSAGE